MIWNGGSLTKNSFEAARETVLPLSALPLEVWYRVYSKNIALVECDFDMLRLSVRSEGFRQTGQSTFLWRGYDSMSGIVLNRCAAEPCEDVEPWRKLISKRKSIFHDWVG
jgi:hypothetical protein